jgi:hypothetical protein
MGKFKKDNQIGKDTQFSSENQPPPENKSAGQQETNKEKERLKTLKEVGIHLFECPVNEANKEEILKKFPNLKDKEIDNRMLTMLTTYSRMMNAEKIPFIDKKGNIVEDKKGKPIIKKTIRMSDKNFIKYMEFWRDTIGEKPIDKVEQNNYNIEIKDKKIVNEVIRKLKSL